MGYPEATRATEHRRGAPSGATSAIATEPQATPSRAAAQLLWAGAASTLHRIRRGEGALLAVNVSLVAFLGGDLPERLSQVLVSLLAILLMYAFNDFYDAPLDANNRKKDRALTSVYLEHRRICGVALLVSSVLAVALAHALLGTHTAAVVAAVLLVNVVYSLFLKAVPVADVVWCGLWGALYAAIVNGSPSLILLVGLMTAVCHVYQTLDDRVSDAENGITTTAVRSAVLSRNVLVALSVLLFATLLAPLGAAWSLTAFAPLALFFITSRPMTGWVLTKVYFAGVWLFLLGALHAAR